MLFKKPIITVSELKVYLANQNHGDSSPWIIFDASFFLPTENRDPNAEFIAGHIPGAQRFDIDEIADRTNPLPHMLPTEADFIDAMEAMGVSRDSSVVVYDSKGIFSSPRAWWMFRYFGHEQVAVLDGGLPAWMEADGEIEVGSAQKTEIGSFIATAHRHRRDWVIDLNALMRSLNQKLILDARSVGRFTGVEKEPRPGVCSGHIPGSKNIPFTTLLNHNKFMKSPQEIREIFAGFYNQGKVETVVLCGSGATACVLALGLEIAGYPAPMLYDGSWSEWGGRSDTPVEVGE